jgi:AraC-like DNA-binding protein
MGGIMKDYTNSQICALIDEHIHSDRDRQILKRRLIDGCCFEPLAEEFGMSDRQIKRIVYKLQEQLFKHL